MVVAIDYRLAPEHPFPTPLEDCYRALEWVFDNGDMLQIDPRNVVVVGDSAGGNLAAGVTHLLRDRDGPSLRHQVLIYPVLNHSFETDSYAENAEGYLLTKRDMAVYWDAYLRSDIDSKNSYASPLQARTLAELPSATVVTCGFDPLRDEGVAYANRLLDAGISVTHHHYDDSIHGIIQLAFPPTDLTPAATIVDDVVADLKRILA